VPLDEQQLVDAGQQRVAEGDPPQQSSGVEVEFSPHLVGRFVGTVQFRQPPLDSLQFRRGRFEAGRIGRGSQAIDQPLAPLDHVAAVGRQKSAALRIGAFWVAVKDASHKLIGQRAGVGVLADALLIRRLAQRDVLLGIVRGVDLDLVQGERAATGHVQPDDSRGDLLVAEVDHQRLLFLHPVEDRAVVLINELEVVARVVGRQDADLPGAVGRAAVGAVENDHAVESVRRT